MPADKICEKLKKKDAQICDLRFGIYSMFISYNHFYYILWLLKLTLYNNNIICFRETNWSQYGKSEEVKGAWFKEDFKWLGRNMWRMYRKDRLY